MISVEPDYASLEKIAVLADAGKLVPRVEASFALGEAPSAHAVLEAGQVQGKLVLTVPVRS